MYDYEKKQLKNMIGDSVWQLLKDTKCVLAGGAITSLFTGKEVNDLDLYVTTKEALGRILSEAYGHSDMDYLGMYELHVKFATERSILMKESRKEIPLQLIHYKVHENVESIFNSFDFTVCMGAFDFATEEFVFHKDFFLDNSRRRLSFNKNTDFPVVSLLRTNKYKTKGYDISKSELLRVAFTIANKDYNSWEDVISECQGMYGIAPEDLFDTTKPFSLDVVVDQLVGVVLKESFENVKTKTQFHEVVELCKQNLAEEFLTWYGVAESEVRKWNEEHKNDTFFYERTVDYYIDKKFEWEDKQDVQSSTTSSFVDFYLN